MSNRKHRSAGHIKDLGNGRWLVRTSHGVDAYGKRIRGNVTVEGTKKDAQRYLNSVLSRQDAGFRSPLSRQTLGEWVAEWLRDWTASLAPRTFADYQSLFRRLFKYEPELGGRRLSDLTPDDVQRVVSRLHSRGLGARTVQMYHAALRVSLGEVERRGKVARNVAALAELPPQRKAERRFLCPTQAETFLRVAEAERDRFFALFAVLILTGIRPGEAFALRWSDLDGRVLQVRRALVWLPGEAPLFEETKTRRARTIALGDRVLRILQRHRSEQVQYRLLIGGSYAGNDLIFASGTGGPLTLRNVTDRHFKPLLKKALLPDVRLYDLRHTHATLLLAAGEHPKVVQERLGHSTITLTLDTYSHVVPGMQERAAERLDQLLATSVPTALNG